MTPADARTNVANRMQTLESKMDRLLRIYFEPPIEERLPHFTRWEKLNYLNNLIGRNGETLDFNLHALEEILRKLEYSQGHLRVELCYSEPTTQVLLHLTTLNIQQQPEEIDYWLTLDTFDHEYAKAIRSLETVRDTLRPPIEIHNSEVYYIFDTPVPDIQYFEDMIELSDDDFEYISINVN